MQLMKSVEYTISFSLITFLIFIQLMMFMCNQHFNVYPFFNLKIQICYLCLIIKCACIWLTFISILLFQNLPLRSLNVNMYVHGIINMSLFLISTNIKLHKFLFSLTSKKICCNNNNNNGVSGNFKRIFRNNEKCMYTYQTTGEMYIVVNIKKQISFRRDVLFITFFELTQLKMF